MGTPNLSSLFSAGVAAARQRQSPPPAGHGFGSSTSGWPGTSWPGRGAADPLEPGWPGGEPAGASRRSGDWSPLGPASGPPSADWPTGDRDDLSSPLAGWPADDPVRPTSPATVSPARARFRSAPDRLPPPGPRTGGPSRLR